MFSTATGEALWSITQINDASINMASETSEVVDAVGNKITEFDRSKSCEISGSNALWDLDLSAAQWGSEKNVATESNIIKAPAYEQLRITNGQVVLKHVPVGTAGAEIKWIYKLNDDSSLGQKYGLSSAASATEFALDAANKTITTPTGLTGNIAVFYDYNSTEAIEIHNNAVDFPKAGRFHLEVLGKDTCNPTEVYVATIVFPNAKLKYDGDLGLQSDSGHPFTITCMQDYCDLEKRLFTCYVTND